MEHLTFTPAEGRAAVGAMVAVAEAEPPFTPGERAWVAAAAQALGFSPGDEDLRPAPPQAVAAAIADPRARERVVQMMLMTALADEAVSPREAAVVADFARELGIDEPRVDSLRLLSEGHVARTWLGLARRGSARVEVERVLKKEGFLGLWRIVGPLLGLVDDEAQARRFNDLGKLPENSLGRVYWRFIVDNGLRFPGETRAVPESGLWHDMSHVLGGYGIDPEGEVQVVSFIAGYKREDPFFWLFTIALQFHLGLRVSPYSQGKTGHFKPDIVFRALERGMAMNTDLSEGWDPWPHMAEPLDQVRALLGVPP